ncbi:hypothetical protein EQW78_04655 [Oerskovia turbata]|uniref:DUF6318 domain-containing protein n=2 Tax=Oerskovia turbata TaxID=1713 RepID=A0A4Q1L023_9CELL|nr:hypothetical protein EQW73_01100 [Oerskovia turbata]RXR36053.1 hypothetical protein EQW78_04655 [Oerskovia turbata]TGJ96602.1 hypothetical protein DLJ96_00385 [Actinotalea fermentans ATCC 43279 = JCM 9966 = DSM 3133]
MLMAGVVLVGVVAGCSSAEPVVESPVPVVSEEPSPSPSPTPAATGPVKPERPADMDRTDEVGAAAAATYFLELYPYVMATGDLTEWDAMTWAELCSFCTASRDRQLQRAAASETYEGGEVKVDVEQSFPLDTLIGGYPLDIRLEQAEAIIRDAAGAEKDRQEGFTGTFRVEMLHDGTNWRVLTVGTEE